jgi:hypothetical protein
MSESRHRTSGAGAPGTLNPPTSRAKPGVDAGAHCIAPCAGGRGELGGKPQGSLGFPPEAEIDK